jgi:hypothetical protein
MCCGKKRAAMQAKPAVYPAVYPARRVQQPMPAAPPVQSGPGLYFEYRGRSALIVIGSVTRARYYFSESGKRLAVDSRDRASIRMIPQLVEVQSP